MTDWHQIGPDTHSNIFMAFETISHDSGGGAGHASYSVHPAWVPRLDEIEAALATLEGDRESSLEGDFSDFCIGEESDMMVLARRSPELMLAHQFLTSFFDDWDKGPDGEDLLNA